MKIIYSLWNKRTGKCEGHTEDFRTALAMKDATNKLRKDFYSKDNRLVCYEFIRE